MNYASKKLKEKEWNQKTFSNKKKVGEFVVSKPTL